MWEAGLFGATPFDWSRCTTRERFGGWRTGTFNVADVAIMVGAFMLPAGELVGPKRALGLQ